jgi:hypothetical protein
MLLNGDKIPGWTSYRIHTFVDGTGVIYNNVTNERIKLSRQGMLVAEEPQCKGCGARETIFEMRVGPQYEKMRVPICAYCKGEKRG